MQSRGEPRTSASSTRAAAGHYCPPYSRARAPRSGRESVAPCGAIEKMDSATAECVDCRADKSARNDGEEAESVKKWILGLKPKFCHCEICVANRGNPQSKSGF
ncbi:hypothetical protein [Helicobacter zhangjianzhongii]|uniref:hypothetical protein n=1 Tax=Helicobacter zhangjianzhongii TaxID=2974574 RepID=UPI0025534DFC|nr:hypothetical protein [Helicobacter sp. CPD2-1]MDL0079927.1 hypothetical protein [Helicobacter sp. CPD2-1]